MMTLRDLKPGNVLVSTSNADSDSDSRRRTYKVADFGLSRVVLGVSNEGEQGRGITGGLGTGLYMSPEMITKDAVQVVQVRKKVLNSVCMHTIVHFVSVTCVYLHGQLQAYPFACDIFSYGILAWQLLADERPYVSSDACLGLSLHQIKHRVVEGLRPEIEAKHGWPTAIVELLVSCWSAEPGHRPTFASVLASLNETGTAAEIAEMHAT